MPHEPSEIEDNVADCSGDELGETVSSQGEPVDMTADCSGDEQVARDNEDEMDTPRKPEPEIVAKKVPTYKSIKPKPEVVVKKGPEYTSRKPGPEIVSSKASSYSDIDDSDDELKELVERKKRLEREKESLSDAKLRRRAERERLKAKLQTDVKTLESEVAELSGRYKGPRR